MYDVCIVGAGVIGASVARALARHRLRTIVVERSDDVSQGASKANSGIVHGGYAAAHGTLKGELSSRGNRMYARLDAELHFGYREIGALVLGFSEEERAEIEKLYENGRANKVDRLEIVGAARLRELEPNVSRDAIAALLCPPAGVTSPYELTIALAENAVANGVELRLGSEVVGIEPGDPFRIHGVDWSIESRFIVNAAGVASDRVAAMVEAPSFSITPRKGEYVLFQKGYGRIVNRVIFQVPTARGKGVLVTPTYHGNLLVGPNAEEVDSRGDFDTSAPRLMEIIETARRSVPDFDLAKVITTFSGLRATPDRRDFIIEPGGVRGFINVAGIESPGLTAAPAIAERVLELLRDAGLSLQPRGDFEPARRPIIVPKSLPDTEVARRIALDSAPERIVCRCEQVTEAEILDCMQRGIPVESVDAVKRRTRAGMGTCQGTFCRPRVKALLARELGVPLEEVALRGDGLAPRRASRRFYRETVPQAERSG